MSITVGSPDTVTGKHTSVLLSGIEPPEPVKGCALITKGDTPRKVSSSFFMITSFSRCNLRKSKRKAKPGSEFDTGLIRPYILAFHVVDERLVHHLISPGSKIIT